MKLKYKAILQYFTLARLYHNRLDQAVLCLIKPQHITTAATQQFRDNLLVFCNTRLLDKKQFLCYTRRTKQM